MGTVQTRNELFTPERIAGMINKVKGHSTLAILTQQEPLAFNGNEVFNFTLDKDIDLVDESGAKSAGGATIEKVKMMPIKVEYSARFSDEMWFSGEEAQLNILKEFTEGYAKKLARGLDLMALHGVNPRTKEASELINSKSFDSVVSQTIVYDAEKVDDVLEDAIYLINGSNGISTGIALSPSAGRDLSKITVNGVRQYPEFRMGNHPDNLAGMKIDINETISAVGNTELYVGDFANAVKWGYAKNIGLQIHTAGDPDNSGRDLAGHNEILLRSETYVGWGILDSNSFARVIKSETP
ncbi:phage major capsid protein [Vagococcus xieshaowenii]|uniref:Phage major capsid protein n=1 Tax=Vagococcus xieshaowenii TaxID=2562451 RepID=A0AAJ5EFK5_9ENTE|nr:phage major capsid protein [Vagococcus xieshaowenii]QCA28251.1 phage major capsid protein [Vagococcus xieshaowenii]TFZ41905.1 phage major capsid protein [Vagococcus xieshaowenii]